MANARQLLEDCRAKGDLLRGENATLKTDLASARSENAILKTELSEVKADLADCIAGDPVTPPPVTPPPVTPTTTALAHDPCTSPDPIPLWKGIYAKRVDGNTQQWSNSLNQLVPGQVEHNASGGPGNKPYRRLRVLAGETSYGSRTELGLNSVDSFHAYREGDEDTTSMWVRLDPGWPASSAFNSIYDCKQAQPYPAVDKNNYGMLYVGASVPWDGSTETRWQVITAETSYSPPLVVGPVARRGAWQKIDFRVHWSKDPAKGWVELFIDGATTGRKQTKTLKYATQAGSGYAVGDSVPGHLRLGVYHDSSLPSTYCDYADVQVAK